MLRAISPVSFATDPVLIYHTGHRHSPLDAHHDSLPPPATDDVDVLMTRTRVPPVLVTGATGRVGRVVVDLLIDAGVPVRALTHRSEAAATLPASVEVVTGDLTVPESLEAALRGVSTVFLVWTAPPTTVPAVVERLATYARRVVFIGDFLGRRIKFEELSPDEFRSETEGSWPRPVVDMLLAAWGAAIGRPAFVTS